jgi:hypothetical protein
VIATIGAVAMWVVIAALAIIAAHKRSSKPKASFPEWFDQLRAYAVAKGGIPQHETSQLNAAVWRREYDDGRTPAEAFWHRAYIRASRGRALTERPAL